MPKRVILSVPAVSAGLLATVIALSTDCTTLAADDCLAQPNRPPAQGGHWYYRVDRINNRKCWYLVEPGTRMPQAEAPEPQPSPDTIPHQTFAGFFSSLAAGFTGTTAGTQSETTNSDARIVQTTHPDDLKNDDAVRGKRPRIARPPGAEAALTPKQHRRPSPTRPLVEHADERAAPSLNQAERDTLFQEFLRWKQRQTP
jgi:hypothetical protein